MSRINQPIVHGTLVFQLSPESTFQTLMAFDNVLEVEGFAKISLERLNKSKQRTEGH